MRSLFVTLFITFFSLSLYSQRVIAIDEIPANTPRDATIYLAATITNWDTGDDGFTFTEVEGVFMFDIPQSAPNAFQGKITRGSWGSVEGNQAGGNISDRTFNFTTSDTLFIQVLSWEDLAGGSTPSDLPPNVITISNDFFIPQLDRNRRVRLCLPLDYDATSHDYPVLYMHDGQNLFSAAESFAGEWKVDEALAYFEENGYSSSSGYPGVIVVAIDNGGSYRFPEYTPWVNPAYDSGEGEEYMEFIVNTLKPYVDENYRTLTDRENTGIMGSSLGGLISHYGAMKYQNVFSKVGVFSPSFWFTDDIYDFTYEQGHQEAMKFYFLAGGQESETLEQKVTNMMDTMVAAGFDGSEIMYKYVANGAHSEWFWAQEFPDAFQWLFLTELTDAPERIAESQIVIFPNPVQDTLYFTLLNENDFADIEVFDASGRLVVSLSRKKNNVDLSNLKAGNYFVKITSQKESQTFNVVKL